MFYYTVSFPIALQSRNLVFPKAKHTTALSMASKPLSTEPKTVKLITLPVKI